MAGQSLELRGANGAGKSSLLRVIAGLVPSTAGSLTFNAKKIFAHHVHYIAHQDAMKSAMTVAENLNFWCAVLGGSGINTALQAFNLTRLQHDPVQLLSAGQRRRSTLARLLLAPRPVWLLDEPMTALDTTTQDHLRQLILSHLETGGMVVAATHGDLAIKPDHTITLGAA
jgi:heme exporter protein A